MGLREEKKRATRRHISDIATGLFAQRGFDNVTVAEVAEAAGVSKMTVFNYFPRKEDLFLDRHDDRLRELERVIRERPGGEDVTTALRRYHHELVAQRHALAGTRPGTVGFLSILYASPALITRTYEQSRETADLLATLLAEETGDPVAARLTANLVAATLDSIYEHACRRMLDGDDPNDVHRDQPAVIDRAFDLLENGLSAAKPRRSRRRAPRGNGSDR
ncbi:TetR/AcrR family transcriptional regulator [Amycolatopsis endophytica]|uniref:AcrR family transcriptional regulator n=1 Tax=Amycolatopsis endophytica TaxID=860233 RepID=A0A853B5E8_9PSEU|nr:TetR family transcriptional regulator [Amycolatopsis endophytica]NYI90035.1 AcrR family transcriptional regulator [Amycolatopsis endophytica]